MNDEILQGYPISAFLDTASSRGWKPETRHRYGVCLTELQAYLAKHGPPGAPALLGWRRQLEQRYSRSCVNAYLTAANHYFRWCGRQDLIQQPSRAPQQEEATPAITRAEYLRLLRTARTQGHHRLYLLIKLFALTGVPLQCLDQVTVELIQKGHGTLQHRGNRMEFYCPPALQRELLEYMALNGIYRGPVFITRTGQLWNRTNIFRAMRELCQAAGVPEEKGNPRCLRGLYKTTQKTIEQQLAILKEKMYDQMLELEQDAIGWQTDPTTSRGRSA